jgi:hypothetical protein
MADENDALANVVPPPDPELKRLEPLLGKWRSEEKTQDTILGPGVRVTNEEEIYWLEGGYFLVQTYNTAFGDEPAQKGINYWYYDAEAKKFRIIFFSNNGPYTEEGNRYGGQVEGNKLTLTGPARFQYELDEDGKIKVNDDGSITVSWWLRDEQGKWQHWMTNRFTKRKE